MKISRVHIENYRSIKSLDFSPNNYCALIGENNAGKSNILKAINLVLGETWPTDRTFTEEDFNNCDTSKDIVIQIYFDKFIEFWKNTTCKIAGFELRGKAYKKRVGTKPAGTLVVDFVCIDKKGKPCQYPATPYKEGERYTGQYYQLKVSKELREKIPFIYVDVMRDYNRQDPSNRWSILRRLFNDINTSLSSDKTTVTVDTPEGKKKLTRKQAFELKIKEAYSFLQTEQFLEIENKIRDNSLEQMGIDPAEGDIVVADDDIKDVSTISDPEKRKKLEKENDNHTRKNKALKEFVPTAQLFWMVPNIEVVMGINENTDNKIKQALDYLKSKKDKDEIAAEIQKPLKAIMRMLDKSDKNNPCN